jgi:hypothetical protein
MIASGGAPVSNTPEPGCPMSLAHGDCIILRNLARFMAFRALRALMGTWIEQNFHMLPTTCVNF